MSWAETGLQVTTSAATQSKVTLGDMAGSLHHPPEWCARGLQRLLPPGPLRQLLSCVGYAAWNPSDRSSPRPVGGRHAINQQKLGSFFRTHTILLNCAAFEGGRLY